jgi:carboxypeptidase PM20D1
MIVAAFCYMGHASQPRAGPSELPRSLHSEHRTPIVGRGPLTILPGTQPADAPVKRFLLALLVALLGLATTIGIRTSQVPSPAGPAAAGAPVAINTDAAAARLAGAVRFATVSSGSGERIDTTAFLALHDFLATSFPRVHATLTRERVNGLSLIYTWRGTDSTAAPLVLMGHMDVVPVPAENLTSWQHAPFSGDIADGFIWGRGTLDDKSTVLAILEAVEAMLVAGERPSRTVYLTFGHDEEVSGKYGAKEIVKTLVARGVKPALVIDEGGVVAEGLVPGVAGRAALVGVAEKGYVSLNLTARAAGGHSSMPPRRTAVGTLSAAIARLEATPFPSSLDGTTQGMLDAMAPYMPFSRKAAFANLWLTSPLVTRALAAAPSSNAMLHTTIAPTMLAAGVKDNVLPPEARAVVNFRIKPGETVESVIAHVRTAIADSTIEIAPRDSAFANPSQVSDAKSPAFALIASTIRGMMPGESLPVIPYLVPGGTDAKFWGPHSDRVFRFLAIPMGSGDTDRIHGVNERVSVTGYGSAIQFFARLLRSLDSLPR